MGLRKIALLVCSTTALVFAAQAEEPKDLQAPMEENNSKWLAAYNSQDAEALGDMYSEDALLIAAGSPPIRGTKDIEAYWLIDVRDYGDHT